MSLIAKKSWPEINMVTQASFTLNFLKMELLVKNHHASVRILTLTGLLYIVITLSAINLATAQQPDNGSDTITVELVWNENRTSLIQIEDQQWTVRANSRKSIEIPVNTVLRLSIITPQETYHADDFLLIEPVSNPVLTIWIDGDKAAFSYDDLETEPAEEEVPKTTNNYQPEVAPSDDAKDMFTAGDTSLGLWKFVQGDCPCELGMEIATYRMGLFGINYAEYGDGTIRHGITAGIAYRGYFFDDVNVQVRTYSGDAGIGYGLSYFDRLFSSLTLNIPIYFKSVTEITINNDTETTEFDDWFNTDAMYLRFRNVFHPWVGESGFLSSLAFTASVDISLAKGGGTSSTIGIGIGLGKTR